MTNTALLPALISVIEKTINDHADEVAELDKAIGDGDHVTNLQRGLAALHAQADALAALDLAAALSKIGMTLMSTMGGASGSLFGSMFVAMGKAAKDSEPNLDGLSGLFTLGVEAIQARGKAGTGEKTMLDTLIPAADSLQQDAANGLDVATALQNMKDAAITGMEATRDMLATKGRASFLGERARGHIDAGARTSQLMICAIADVILEKVK